MQDAFHKADKHNIVKIILGKEEKKDTPHKNKYSRAAKLFGEWLKKKIFIKDRKPSIYIYTQAYLHKGKKRTRFGFTALMKIEDPRESGILPHEYTLEAPKKDRLNLIKNTKANLSPIFSLFQDKENKINKILKRHIRFKSPFCEVEREAVTHKLWRMDAKIATDKIRRHMKGKKIFIADGHHRYEVALAYRNMMRKTRHFKRGMDYVMMYFSNLSERGNLTILSTHRVVKNTGYSGGEGFLSKLKKDFDITKAASVKDVVESIEKEARAKHAIGMYAGRNKFYILTLKNKRAKRLDVEVLHDLVINKLLGIKNSESSIKYVRSEKDAALLVDKGDYEVAFFLRPTAISDMRALAEKGKMMPQKSTYFYPKLLTGLVINQL